MSDGLKLLSVSVVARRLNCSEKNIYNLISCGELQCVRVGVKKGFSIPESEIAAFIERRTVKPDCERFV